jgi:hypothetical protein
MPTRGAPRTYEIRARFRAPLPYVFAWCTDYSADDPRLAKEDAERKIVRRDRRSVVYEDLDELGSGWSWSRQTVTLEPPRRWHAEARGNLRDWSLDYSLKAVGAGVTELLLHGVRTPTALGGANPSRPSLERELRTMWRHYATALERDYRASLRRADGGARRSVRARRAH